jgi:hypothetical protein
MEVDNIAVFTIKALDVAGCVGWFVGSFLREREGENVMLSGLQVGFHADEGGLYGAADRACADEIDAVEEWKYGRDMFALLAAFWCQIWVGNVLVVLRIVVPFGMSYEMNCSWSHDAVLEEESNDFQLH